jgi:hypothetical protein
MISKNSKLNDFLINSTDNNKQRAEKFKAATSLKDNLQRWTDIVDAAIEHLNRLNNPSLAQSDRRKDASILPKGSYSLDDYVRFNRAVYISVIWAIFNRLILAKREEADSQKANHLDKDLLPIYESLLHKVTNWIERNPKFASVSQRHRRPVRETNPTK